MAKDFIWVVVVGILAVASVLIGIFSIVQPARNAAEEQCTQAGGVYVHSARRTNICVRTQIINIEQVPTKG